MADQFYPVEEYQDGERLPAELWAIKALVTRHPESLNGCFKYISEGKLDGVDALICDIAVSVPIRSPFNVKDIERVAITYSNNKNSEFQAYTLRSDFPILPHQNLVLEGKPKHLCLFDGPQLDKTYNEPLKSFLLRVKRWLDRAARGELHLDEQGMEPFIMITAGYIAIDSTAENQLCNSDLRCELAVIGGVPRDLTEGMSYLETVSLKKGQKIGVPMGAVVPIRSKPTSKQIISNTPLLYPQLEKLVYQTLGADLAQIIADHISFLIKTKGLKSQIYQNPFIILVIPRQNSSGELAGHEFVGFMLNKKLCDLGVWLGSLEGRKRKNGILHVFTGGSKRNEEELGKVVLLPFSIVRRLSAKAAMDMSASNRELSDVSVSVIGLGALGSHVVLNLAKQGLATWKLIDDDMLLPHNFARHAASAERRGQLKTDAIEVEIRALLEDAKVRSYSSRFVGGMDAGMISKMLDSGLILDTSASYSVQLELAYNENVSSRVASAYYCGAGSTSVLLTEDALRTIRIDDIDLQLKVFALDNKMASSIFRTRNEPELAYASSCSSRTAVMAQDMVATHAGILSRQLRDILKKDVAFAHLNCINSEGYSVKSIGFTPQEPVVYSSNGWEFRISQSAIKDMAKLRGKKLPNETGGILIGWINSRRKVVYVGKTLPAPADSVERPYSFVRGKDGLPDSVMEIEHKTNSDLYYVGEWHSHPLGSAVGQSKDDLNSMFALKKTMGSDALPGVMIIIGDDEQIGCYAEQEW